MHTPCRHTEGMRSGRRRALCVLTVTLGVAAVFGGGETTARDAGLQVRVVAVDGSGGRVMGGMSVAVGPAWSPGGGRIAFARESRVAIAH
jgi:hypothetical protein